MHVHLQTLGCRLNEAELESWAIALDKQGHTITPDPEAAQLIIMNSCAVTQDAVRKSRHLVRQMQRANPSAKLVLSGCYATLQAEEAESLGVDLVVENRDKDQLVTRLTPLLDSPAMPAAATLPAEQALFTLGRQRAFIKVQDGCRYRCTFCVVTLARGEEISRPIVDIVDEINALHRQGIHECVLTGVHLGGYGSDQGQDLYALIRAVLELTDMERIRLGSLEPWDLPEGFWHLFENPRLMPHVHLPMQSGSDTVLKRMARRCHTRQFAALAAAARSQVPGINLTTDIMVGFPGETEAEFQETCQFIEQMQFGHIHLFSYSSRPGTRAAMLPNQIHGTTKRERLAVLQGIARQSRQTILYRQVGQRCEVLWENPKNDVATGYTPQYFKVAMQTALPVVAGQLTAIEITHVDATRDLLWATQGA